MKIHIQKAVMRFTEEEGYLGQVEFTVENHREPYEITLQSGRGRDWAYSLHFLRESGPEDEILAVEDKLETDDELFDRILEAAEKAFKEGEA